MHRDHFDEPSPELLDAIRLVLENNQDLDEGMFGRGVAIATLIAQSAFGNFAADWSKYYQGTNNPKKTARAVQVLEKGYSVPADAKRAIKIAANIFDGDRGHSKKEIMDYLEKTGAVETHYKTKVQYGGGPARSYWQVEPKTAMSLVKHSPQIFGNKFKKTFGDKSVDIIRKWGEKDWAKALETNGPLGATMAAAKWISTSW